MTSTLGIGVVAAESMPRWAGSVVSISGLAELNRLLAAWVETVYHTQVHSETGLAPLARWRAGIPDPLPLPTPAQLREAFLWSEFRTVTANATVSLHNNRYQVDELLIGREFGKAVAFTIGRHSHPKARPEQPTPQPSPAGSTTCACSMPATPSSWNRGPTTPALLGDQSGDSAGDIDATNGGA